MQRHEHCLPILFPQVSHWLKLKTDRPWFDLTRYILSAKANGGGKIIDFQHLFMDGKGYKNVIAITQQMVLRNLKHTYN